MPTVESTAPTTRPFPNLLVPNDDLLLQCIHCGMCLATCPTYTITLRERSSPRGRIRLIKAVAEGQLPLTETFQYEMFFCLDCRACETACPAGVHCGELVEAARTEIETREKKSGRRSPLKAFLLEKVFTQPSLLRRLARALRLYQRSGLETLALRLHLPRLLSKKLDELAPLAPTISPKFTHDLLPEILPAQGEMRYRVAMLSGCVQDVAFAEINRDTALVLAYNGCEVWTPRQQVCCGSLHGHVGDRETAVRLAAQNIELFNSREIDAVIVNAAGCGSFMKSYGELFSGIDHPRISPEAAEAFSAKVKDVHEFLVEIGFRKPEHPMPQRVTYHDACHLAHGQNIRSQPREILRSIPGIEFVELPEADWCCGSAGIYNITHTETAAQLLRRKVGNIQKTGASIVASANPGCSIQIQSGLTDRGERSKSIRRRKIKRMLFNLPGFSYI